MPATPKHKAKAGEDVVDRATNNLLKALKKDMVRKEGGVNSGKLRKEGYSDRLIARLEDA